MPKKTLEKKVAARIGAEIGRLRSAVDRLDARLIALLSRRAELARKIGAIKRAHRLPAIDLKRERAILERALKGARGFSKQQLRRIVATILKESRRIVKP